MPFSMKIFILMLVSILYLRALAKLAVYSKPNSTLGCKLLWYKSGVNEATTHLYCIMADIQVHAITKIDDICERVANGKPLLCDSKLITCYSRRLQMGTT